mmetsp:Transcript_17016/g.51234  ORF Transcript_17016/g.51234 Transcript_17016/m.51234 type:complete len:221 (+) Transcript_17016:124-786(+)
MHTHKRRDRQGTGPDAPAQATQSVQTPCWRRAGQDTGGGVEQKPMKPNAAAEAQCHDWLTGPTTCPPLHLSNTEPALYVTGPMMAAFERTKRETPRSSTGPVMTPPSTKTSESTSVTGPVMLQPTTRRRWLRSSSGEHHTQPTSVGMEPPCAAAPLAARACSWAACARAAAAALAARACSCAACTACWAACAACATCAATACWTCWTCARMARSWDCCAA